MSNIGIFVGRRHHLLKLYNVGMSLSKNHNVMPVTANNSINIDPPQMDLGEHIHVYDFLTTDNIDFADNTIDHKSIYADTPAFWKYHSTRELVLSYFGFKNWLRSDQKPDAVLILHENNFWTKQLAYLCNRYAIPCFSFQEGILRNSDQITLKKQTYSCEYSTKMFVWGERVKKDYIKSGIPESKIIVSGPPHLDLASMKKGKLNNNFKVITYFLPLLQHYGGNILEDLSIISSYCEKNNFRLIVRPHPFEMNIDMPFLIDRQEEPFDALLHSDVILVQHSTVAMESLALRVPIIEFSLSGNFIQSLSKENHYIPCINSANDLDKIKYVINQGDNYFNAYIVSWVNAYIDASLDSISIITEEIEKNL